MDYRVYHPHLISEPLNVNSSVVQFDANGVSEELSPTDYQTLLSIPGYRSMDDLLCEAAEEEVASWSNQGLLVVDEDLGAVEALPEEAEPTQTQAESDDTGQVVAEHDEDLTLLNQVLTAEVPEDAFSALLLMERLDVASNPQLTRNVAETLFATESTGKKSKRVLTELDRRLQLLRSSQTAQSVTDAMLKTNFPRTEER